MPISLLRRQISLSFAAVFASDRTAPSQLKSPSVCGAFKMRRSRLLVPVAHRSDDSQRRLMAAEWHTTAEHNVICNRAEEWNSRLTTVKRTGRGGTDGSRWRRGGQLRINFPGCRGKESLEEISRQDFSDKYGEKKPAFLYQEKTSSGDQSRLCKFVRRGSKDVNRGIRRPPWRGGWREFSS
jgi:hypothetical protein